MELKFLLHVAEAAPAGVKPVVHSAVQSSWEGEDYPGPTEFTTVNSAPHPNGISVTWCCRSAGGFGKGCGEGCSAFKAGSK